MSQKMNRRTFVKGSMATSAIAGVALAAAGNIAKAQEQAPKPDTLPCGKIGSLQVSRVLLGGNLLTHYTHSRDLKYVYTLTAHYNTREKILETLAVAEDNGINTLSIHTAPGALEILKEHRRRGGKMQWIICPTADIDDKMEGYAQQCKQIVDDGTNAIYLWGVRADPLAAGGKIDLLARAVDIAKNLGVPSGVGCHDLNVVVECEKNKVNNDFYIKTLHHHNYPSAPKPDELKGAINENPGYWCKDPQAVIDVMKNVTKPWIAFKVMAAGAINPTSAFKYALQGGADFLLAGMFDFEIKDDVQIVKGLLQRDLTRERPACS